MKNNRTPHPLRLRLSRLGLRGRIFAYFLLFAAVMIALLWLLQIAYLDRFYERIKIAQIESAAGELAAQLEAAPEGGELQTFVGALAQKKQACIMVYQVNYPQIFMLDTQRVADADVIVDCIIHHISERDIASFYNFAVTSGGAYSQRFTRTLFTARPAEQDGQKPRTFWDRLSSHDESGLADSLVYAQVVVTSGGGTHFLLLNSSLTPVNATISALRIQLFIVSGVLIILALALSTVSARRLSRPIAQINAAAHRLAAGDFSGKFYAGGYREISELADTLNFASAELAKSGRLQQDIVANISHDLRTPLTMIGGYAEFMRDFPEEDHSESVGVIVEETARLAALVKDVLDDSRLRSGVETLQPAEFDFTESLRAFISRYNKLIEKDGYCIELTAPEEATVRADEQRMMQVVGNLLNNALTHIGEDKLIRVTQILRGQTLRVEIADNGPGIAPEDLPNIWQRYYRTHAPQRGRHGSGLGLSIVRSVLELHHARYGVESELGRGSMFWFELDL